MAGNPPIANEPRLSRVTQAVRELFEGRSNAVGTITLRAGQTTTTVTATNCGLDSRVFLMPTTAHASAEFGNGTIYVSSVGQGTFTITHASDANADKTYFWLAIG